MPLASGDRDGDESEVRRFFRQHFQDITTWSRNHVKDLIGIPFVPPSSQQPPFTIDQQQQQQSSAHRKRSRDRYWSPQRQWQRGDPIVAIFMTPVPKSRGQLHAGLTSPRDRETRQLEMATAAAEEVLQGINPHRREVLNLPDGSTMLDLCYPGWEVAILPEDAMPAFWSRRWLFGDYYGHLLTGRTSTRMAKGAGQSPTAKERDNPFTASVSSQPDLYDAAVPSNETQAEKRKRAGALTEEQVLAAFGRSEAKRAAQRRAVFEQRRSPDVQQAAEAQQRRGVPFDAHPAVQEQEQQKTSGPDDLVKLEVIAQQIVTPQGQTGRFSVRRTYKDGRTEVSDMSRNATSVDEATQLDESAAQRMRLEFDASFTDTNERT